MRKFAVGEIAIALGYGSPKECRIVRFSKKPTRIGHGPVYVIDVPRRRSSARNGFWLIPESHLRKKRPPKEDDANDLTEVRKWVRENIDMTPRPAKIPEEVS